MRRSWDGEPVQLALQPRPVDAQLGAHAPQRPALPGPPHPQVAFHVGEAQPGQPRLPLGSPPGGPPLARPLVAGGRPLPVEPVPVEAVADGGGVHAELPCELPQRPRPLDDPVDQVGPQAREAQRGRSQGELPVGGAAALPGSGHRRRWRLQACLVEQAPDDQGGGAKLAAQLREAGLLLPARREVAGEVGEPQRPSTRVEHALLAVDHGEAAVDREPAR